MYNMYMAVNIYFFFFSQYKRDDVEGNKSKEKNKKILVKWAGNEPYPFFRSFEFWKFLILVHNEVLCLVKSFFPLY